MEPAGIPALGEAIRHMHGCEAEHAETNHVHERSPNGETVWEGDVEAFAIAGHPKAQCATRGQKPQPEPSTGKMGRPPKPAGEAREIVFTLRLNEAERGAIV